MFRFFKKKTQQPPQQEAQEALPAEPLSTAAPLDTAAEQSAVDSTTVTINQAHESTGYPVPSSFPTGAHEQDQTVASIQPVYSAIESSLGTDQVEPDAEAPAPVKSSWLSRLKQGLSRTGKTIGGLFVGVKVDERLFEELETALIMADAGVDATAKLLSDLRAKVKKE